MFSKMRTMSLSLDDINRKSIISKVSRERLHTYSFDQSTPPREDYISVPESDILDGALGDTKAQAAIEKRCREYDIYNESIFKRNYKLYQSILQKLQHTTLELKQSPLPAPSPNNQERLNMCKLRNKSVNCLQQTNAVMYLISHGYELVQERKPESGFSMQFEAYQAVEMATALSHSLGEDFMFRTNNHSNTARASSQANQPSCPSYLSTYPQLYSQMEPECMQHEHGKLACQNPEHHSVHDKIDYYNRQPSAPPI
jgi:hypothetical protein